MSQKYEKLKTLLKELFQARPARPGLRPLPRDACQERRGVAVRRQGKAQGALGRSKFDGKKQDIRALLSKDVSKASIPKRSVASPAAPLAWSNLPSCRELGPGQRRHTCIPHRSRQTVDPSRPSRSPRSGLWGIPRRAPRPPGRPLQFPGCGETAPRASALGA